MTTNDNDAPRDGGAEWESGAAADATTDAAEAFLLDPTPENKAAFNKALRDVNAALGSRATGAISSMLGPLMAQLQTIAQQQQHVTTAVRYIEAEGRTRRESHAMLAHSFHESKDAFSAELDRLQGLNSLPAVLQDVRSDVADIKKNWQDMGTWQAEVDAWRGRQDEQREAEHERQETRHVEIIARFERDEARLDKKRIELDSIHQEIDEIRAYIAANRRAELDELKQRVADLEAQVHRRADGSG
jgi:DNA repair exonuclease SbcCD ATPase subunit